MIPGGVVVKEDLLACRSEGLAGKQLCAEGVVVIPAVLHTSAVQVINLYLFKYSTNTEINNNHTLTL